MLHIYNLFLYLHFICFIDSDDCVRVSEAFECDGYVGVCKEVGCNETGFSCGSDCSGGFSCGASCLWAT